MPRRQPPKVRCFRIPRKEFPKIQPGQTLFRYRRDILIRPRTTVRELSFTLVTNAITGGRNTGRYPREIHEGLGHSTLCTISYTGYDLIRLIHSHISYQRYFYMRMRNAATNARKTHTVVSENHPIVRRISASRISVGLVRLGYGGIWLKTGSIQRTVRTYIRWNKILRVPDKRRLVYRWENIICRFYSQRCSNWHGTKLGTNWYELRSRFCIRINGNDKRSIIWSMVFGELHVKNLVFLVRVVIGITISFN